MTQPTGSALLTVTSLKVWFPVARKSPWEIRRYVRAVDGVDLTVARGQTLGLVGESGSGKTTVGRAILRLIPATAGTVVFDGRDVLAMRGGALRSLRQQMQIIFQDPMGSLNPRMTVETIVTEPLAVRTHLTRRSRSEKAAELLDRVGLSSLYLKRYPHEFSGGQRQRIGIARALASSPDFIVCDEPVSALDVSIQAQILNLFVELQEKRHIAYLFISHDLRVVEHISDRVAVMYLGKIVETARASDLYQNPLHPYTRILLNSVPLPDPKLRKQRSIISGNVPSPVNPPPGCSFHPRCPHRHDNCQNAEPELIEYAPGHFAACHYIPVNKA